MQLINLRNLFLCLFVAVSVKSNAQNKLPQLGKSAVSEIVKAMTLEEKASLVVGTGLRMAGSNAPVIGQADGRVSGAAGNTMSIERFNIVGTVLADGPAGVRIDPFHKGDSSKSYYATAFPVGTLLASSWDTALVKKVGVAFGNEIKEYGVDVILAPGMNIQRNPLNGRNFEYYSEDPVVTGYMASAMVKGIQSNGVGTSIKHFAANNQETKRGVVNAIVSERAIREIYLRGFEIAVKNAQPWTVMSSYNKINGTYTSERKDLLTDILRSEWGFKGIVMTDWYGGRNPDAQMNAGNDLIQPGSKGKSEAIIDAVNKGTLDVNVLNQNVGRILHYVLKTPSFQNYKYSNQPDLKAHATISRNAATEGMVLLKNENGTLPLKNGLRLALFGNGSYETIIGGTGSGEVNTAYTVSLAQGLSVMGFILSENVKSSYTAYIQQDKLLYPKKALTVGAPRMTPELVVAPDVISKNADDADIAIVTISRNAGEGADRKWNGDFNISDTEKVAIKNIADAFHAKGKKLIVVLNIGGAIETASWRNNADAILLVWQPGQEAGNAIADVMAGVVNPSGKLATTFPIRYEDDASAKNFPSSGGKTDEVVYEEGIYVGYRFYSSFGVKPAFPFGYGLSYTTFSYSNLKLSSSSFSQSMNATVTVTNMGKVAGKEVVQLYLSAPQAKLDKPSEELKGFAKSALLKPGASQTITFTLTPKDLASFNTMESRWIADAGTYVVKIGASSENINLSKSFTLPKEMIVEKVNKALMPQTPINELKVADAQK